MSNTFCPELEERLVRYAAVETTSDETSATMPSTATQLELQRMLQRELVDIGASDVQLDANGFVYATIPATAGGDIPRVALLAHVDTVAGVGSGRELRGPGARRRVRR